MLLALDRIFIWTAAKTSTKWQAYQKQINQDLDVASGRFAESILQIKVVKSFIQEVRELKFFDRYLHKAVKTTNPQSQYWHKQDVARRSVLSIIFFTVFMF